MAARALAAAGIVVLQIGAPSNGYATAQTPAEGVQEVAGYEAAIDALTKEGIVDRDKVGIVGFSRTVYGVLLGMTGSSARFAAATIAEGVQFGYLEYLLSLDSGGNAFAREADAVIGAAPFGAGLETWVRQSPQFNLDRVNAPLRIEGYSPLSIVFMWGPYAALRYLHKPVDLILINSDEHVQINPAARFASQQGAVDWFRFWLQGYEASDPAKAPQYRRWERLCDAQIAQNAGHPAFCVGSRDAGSGAVADE